MTNPTKQRLTLKPQGPSTLFIKFSCSCGKEHVVCESFAEWSDLGDGDSLDFHCDCGAYYKKTGRIADDAIVDRWYEEVT